MDLLNWIVSNSDRHKFRFAYYIYYAIMSILSTNKSVNNIGYFYNKKITINLQNAVDHILSDTFILTLIYFLCYIIVFSVLIPYTIVIISTIIINYISKIIKKKSGLSNDEILLLSSLAIYHGQQVFIYDNLSKKFLVHPNNSNIIESNKKYINSVDSPARNFISLNSIFLVTLFSYYFLDVSVKMPILFGVLIVSTTVLFTLLSILVIYTMNVLKITSKYYDKDLFPLESTREKISSILTRIEYT